MDAELKELLTKLLVKVEQQNLRIAFLEERARRLDPLPPMPTVPAWPGTWPGRTTSGSPLFPLQGIATGGVDRPHIQSWN